MLNQPTAGDPRARRVDVQRLWAGGCAAALVAALIAVAGVLIFRGVFDVPILAPKGDGAWGDASTAWYAMGAAAAALAATAVMHLLVLTTPRPRLFFGWIVGLATVIAVVIPFTAHSSVGAKFATAGINLVIGVAIGTLVSTVAAGSARTRM